MISKIIDIDLYIVPWYYLFIDFPKLTCVFLLHWPFLINALFPASGMTCGIQKLWNKDTNFDLGFTSAVNLQELEL
jgi:hypothetical protein